MQSRSVRASQSGQQKLQDARAFKRSDDGERLTFERLAEKAGVSESTVKRFFNGEPVDRSSALKITEALGLQLTDISEPVDLDTFYVERSPIESDCNKAILQPGALIRIKAPQQMGKTLLLNRILDYVTEQKYEAVTLDFEENDSTVFNDIKKFSQYFCASVCKLLGLPNQLTDHWDDIYGCNHNTTNYFEDYLLAKRTSPLVLALDKLDKVFEQPAIADDFCRLLRSWNDKAKSSNRRSAIWKQLRLILVHSTEFYSSLDINHSPLANVGVVVPLPEFTTEQVQKLAKRYQLNSVSIQEVEQLMAMVGGHPYLMRQAFDYLQRQKMTLSELLQIAPTEAGPFGDHLRKHLWNLQQNLELATALSEVVNTNKPVRLKSDQAFKLYSMGLVQLQGNDCSPRCDLYTQYFSVRLATT